MLFEDRDDAPLGRGSVSRHGVLTNVPEGDVGQLSSRGGALQPSRKSGSREPVIEVPAINGIRTKPCDPLNKQRRQIASSHLS